jgi:enoyl-CoA hydratase/carnithine racemase
MAVKTFELIDYEVRDRTAWITINNAERMNALSIGVVNGLYDAFEEFTNDDDALVAVLIGGGGRAFCAGADLVAMTQRDQTEGQGAPAPTRPGLEAVSECPKPIIAAIDGYALAGGMQLSSRCDIRIATEKSRVGMPEVRRSLVAVGMVDTAERYVPRGEAMWILLTADHMTAERAFDIGFLQALVPDRDALIVEAERVAGEIKKNAPLAVAAVKRTILQTSHMSPLDAIHLRNALNEKVEQSEDRMEGPKAFAEKRDPVWKMR